MNLVLPERCLAVFVDDTGHENLVRGHPVYGLGGCAVMANGLEHLVRAPWREVRRAVTGSPDRPLHASAFGQEASQDRIRVVADFFRDNEFARLGAIISTGTVFDEVADSVRVIAGVLKNRIAEIARWTAFTEMKVIFESSDRANRLVETAFADFRLCENGNEISVECFFMPKAAGEPALEVADFVMHAVGPQARRRLEGREGFAPDFSAVFHTVDRRLVSFMEVDTVRRATP